MALFISYVFIDMVTPQNMKRNCYICLRNSSAWIFPFVDRWACALAYYYYYYYYAHWAAGNTRLSIHEFDVESFTISRCAHYRSFSFCDCCTPITLLDDHTHALPHALPLYKRCYKQATSFVCIVFRRHRIIRVPLSRYRYYYPNNICITGKMESITCEE